MISITAGNIVKLKFQFPQKVFLLHHFPDIAELVCPLPIPHPMYLDSCGTNVVLVARVATEDILFSSEALTRFYLQHQIDTHSLVVYVLDLMESLCVLSILALSEASI